jgi:hypothetical protein
MRRTHRALAMLALSLALVGATTAAAVAAPPAPTGIEDQNDRLLRNLQAQEAERTQAAVTLARAMERKLAPLPAGSGVVAAQPAPRTDTASPGHDVDVLATLLLGLVGGLVGGAAAMAGWTAATRRRLHRVTAAT